MRVSFLSSVVVACVLLTGNVYAQDADMMMTEEAPPEKVGLWSRLKRSAYNAFGHKKSGSGIDDTNDSSDSSSSDFREMMKKNKGVITPPVEDKKVENLAAGSKAA
ncbi:unnamed protein product [Hyaloperonospora brassicae]|uniref:RxLR effector protein n=1 Tax=Hyaloperonospora brassicae TaxID=162125 RepID=A0AAV0UCU0_HYABA|nr:unnamed protein product [Hyaloperonospora brassicae]